MKGKRVDFLRHLKRGPHGVLTMQQLEEAWKEARSCMESHAAEHKAKARLAPSELWKYRKGGRGVGELHSLPGLPEVFGKKCPTCDTLYEKDDALRFHMRVDHKSSLS